MTLNPDNTHSLVLNGSGTIQYKFTRGSWTKVEKGSSCEELSNRTFTFGSSTTENAQVVNWADLCGTGTQTHTAQSNVTIMNTSFSMPQLNRNRRIWIYLPADYSTTTKKYPVLYSI